MFTNARRGTAGMAGLAGLVGVVVAVGFSYATASAEPLPLPPQPEPAAIVQPAGVAMAPAAATVTPATSVTLADFLKSKGVAMEVQKAADFKSLNIVLPMPQGWSTVPDPNVPDAFAVIADRVGGDGLYSSNAALVVYKLVGDFDAKEAISHGLIDSQQQPAWRATDGSLADFGGMPSSIIEGTYRQNNMTLNASRRHVLATSGHDRYLVTLTVTTSAQVSVASAASTDAIVRGFRVVDPTAPVPAPAPLAAAAAPAAASPAAAPLAAVAAPAASLPGARPVNQLLTQPR